MDLREILEAYQKVGFARASFCFTGVPACSCVTAHVSTRNLNRKDADLAHDARENQINVKNRKQIQIFIG